MWTLQWVSFNLHLQSNVLNPQKQLEIQTLCELQLDSFRSLEIHIISLHTCVRDYLWCKAWPSGGKMLSKIHTIWKYSVNQHRIPPPRELQLLTEVLEPLNMTNTNTPPKLELLVKVLEYDQDRITLPANWTFAWRT